MAQINLLPWRVEQRERRNRDFIVQMAGVAAAAALISFLIWSFFSQQLSAQREANDIVTQANTALDRDLEAIKALEDQRQEMVERIKIIQDLQGTRPVPVHVFDSLVRAMPANLYLTQISREGDVMRLSGRADNPNTVSDLLRNLDATEWMEKSKVQAISTATTVTPSQNLPTQGLMERPPEEKYISFEVTTQVVAPITDTTADEGDSNA